MPKIACKLHLLHFPTRTDFVDFLDVIGVQRDTLQEPFGCEGVSVSTLIYRKFTSHYSGNRVTCKMRNLTNL